MTATPLVDPDKVLAQLKPFQQLTAIHAFDRLKNGASGRFLVADEVGLGKTLVARAVVAQMIEHLVHERTPRIDVVYVCSNLAIARQNLRKLNPTSLQEHEHRVRLTLLPVEMTGLAEGTPDQPALNFIALTPQTSLSMGNRTGAWPERALMHWLITDLYPDLSDRRGLLRAFGYGLRGSLVEVGVKAAERFARFREARSLTPGYEDRFAEAVTAHDAVLARTGQADTYTQLVELDGAFTDARKSLPSGTQELRKQLVGRLRGLVASTAVALLEPDLVILDEFQRFKDLLGDPEQDPLAELAQAMMTHVDVSTGNRARVLLLSATPYKPVSLRSDEDPSNHYGDLMETVRFLADDADTTATVRDGFSQLHHAMLAIPASGVDAAAAASRTLSESLRELMSRTERLAVTPDRDGMLTTIKLPVTITAADVAGYLAQATVSDHVESSDPIEMWKSAPWLLSFMEKYQLSTLVERATDKGDQALRRLLAPDDVTVPADGIDQYLDLAPPNGRYRALRDWVLGDEQWKLAWLPPSLPYYRANGPYDRPAARAFTKHLVFSQWRVVPKAVSALLSYDAERQMRRQASISRGYQATPSQNLALRVERGEPRAMATLGLLMPSPALAELGDPLRIVRIIGGADGELPSLDAVRSRVREDVDAALDRLPPSAESGQEDFGWYAIAPLLLERALGGEPAQWIGEAESWWQAWAGASDDSEGSTQLSTHTGRVWEYLIGERTLGRRPDDLSDVVMDMAIGGPANVAYRALSRLVPSGVELPADVRDRAAQIAWSFRSLFNGPELQDVVTELHPGLPYWRAVLTYCVDGHLQAVMDEYVHTFADWRGFVTTDVDALLDELAQVLANVLTLRTTTHVVRTWDEVEGRGVRRDPDPRLRVHFAIPFGARLVTDEEDLRRTVAVSDAFNSPFWPFVVISTSIGQEGLDFHLYSHALVHWNLPPNPVDLEQREGRVHRYKGHAVRKNVATAHGRQALLDDTTPDIWGSMFERAAGEATDGDGITPWWVFPGEATIQRVLLLPPFSREQGRYAELQRSLGHYRLALGSPRQDELLAYLSTLDDDLSAEAAQSLHIDLSPPPHDSD